MLHVKCLAEMDLSNWNVVRSGSVARQSLVDQSATIMNKMRQLEIRYANKA